MAGASKRRAQSQTPERSVSPEVALATARHEIRRMGLTFRLDRLGERLPTYRCTLHNAFGIEMSAGSGKGSGAQARASAVFEALEHLLSQPTWSQAKSEYVAVGDIVCAPLLKGERVIELMRRENPALQLHCRLFEALNGGESFYYPLFLLVPSYVQSPDVGDTFPYHIYAKYSTNNGTAIGMNRTEAMIHAISELLERDALSCFLLQTYIAEHAAPVQRIEKGSLPAMCQALLQEVETLVQRDVLLIDMTNDLGVSACLALIHTPGRILPAVGAGASLNCAYAIERALLEVLQVFRLHDEELEGEDRNIVQAFQPFRRYQACVLLDMSACSMVERQYGEMPHVITEPGSLDAHLDLLVRRVADHGYCMYFVTEYASELGITCVRCVIPGLERFHLVRAGMPVVPAQRGMRLIGKG